MPWGLPIDAQGMRQRKAPAQLSAGLPCPRCSRTACVSVHKQTGGRGRHIPCTVHTCTHARTHAHTGTDVQAQTCRHTAIKSQGPPGTSDGDPALFLALSRGKCLPPAGPWGRGAEDGVVPQRGTDGIGALVGPLPMPDRHEARRTGSSFQQTGPSWDGAVCVLFAGQRCRTPRIRGSHWPFRVPHKRPCVCSPDGRVP